MPPNKRHFYFNRNQVNKTIVDIFFVTNSTLVSLFYLYVASQYCFIIRRTTLCHDIPLIVS
jgi:hypothetical protein